jgi:hypothetical protein
MGFDEWIQSQNVIDLGHINPTFEEIEEDLQKTQDAKAYIIGLCMSVIGTLILTFGGLFGVLLG